MQNCPITILCYKWAEQLAASVIHYSEALSSSLLMGIFCLSLTISKTSLSMSLVSCKIFCVFREKVYYFERHNIYIIVIVTKMNEAAPATMGGYSSYFALGKEKYICFRFR